MSGADIVAAVALGATIHPDRPRLPVRADGRRRSRRRPGHRDPVRAGRAHHAPARRHLSGGTHSRTRDTARQTGPAAAVGGPSEWVGPTTATTRKGVQMAAGMRDVAAAASVSVGTVSNVLNAPHKVAPATVARVHAAIDKLGFVRNDAARQLKAQRSRCVALLVLDVGNPFFTDVARGAERRAAQLNLTVLLGHLRRRRHPRTLLHRHLRRAAGIRPAGVPGQ